LQKQLRTRNEITTSNPLQTIEYPERQHLNKNKRDKYTQTENNISPNNNNSLNQTRVISFVIGVVIGFFLLGLGQIIFGKKKENEIKELRENLQKTKNELLLVQNKMKNQEENRL
jgi:Na+/melibiose symporter-like transporter